MPTEVELHASSSDEVWPIVFLAFGSPLEIERDGNGETEQFGFVAVGIVGTSNGVAAFVFIFNGFLSEVQGWATPETQMPGKSDIGNESHGESR